MAEASRKADDKAGAAAQEAVAKAIEQENAQGYRGVKVDQADNRDYTVAGVTGR